MIKSEDVLTVNVPAPNIKEIKRYAGCKDGADELINSLLSEISDFTYKVRYKVFDIKKDGDLLDLSFAKVKSNDLSKNLENSAKIVLFAATLGVCPDRLIAKYSRLSPSKALFLQAISTERIEALCDSFCLFLKTEFEKSGFYVCPRFSAGYGDLPLIIQKDIFKALDCERKLGITLNEKLLMLPTKSVTAIVGLKKNI